MYKQIVKKTGYITFALLVTTGAFLSLQPEQALAQWQICYGPYCVDNCVGQALCYPWGGGLPEVVTGYVGYCCW